DRELKGRGEVVEGDELLVRNHRDRQGATAVARQHRQRGASRRLAGQRRDESDEDDEWKRGREKWQRTSAQMEIPHLIVLGTGLPGRGSRSVAGARAGGDGVDRVGEGDVSAPVRGRVSP